MIKEEKEQKKLTIFEILTKSLPISLNIIIDYLPFTITMIYFKILNKPENQEIIGLATTYFTFFFGFFVAIQDVIGINCSKELGKKNYRGFWSKFFVYLFIDLFLIFISSLFVLFSKQFLILIKIKESIVVQLSSFLIKLLYAKILENLSICLKSILIAQKIAEFFIYLSIINFLVFFLSSYLTIMVYKLGLNGFIISFYLKTIIELLILLIMTYKFSNVDFIYPKFKEIFKDFWEDFKYCLFILFGVFSGFLSFELLTYYVALTGKRENINSWCFVLIYVYYVYCCNVGFYSTFRTYGSIAVGEKNQNKYNSIWKKVFWTGQVFVGIVNLFGFIFSKNIAGIFSNDKKTLEITSNLIQLWFFIRPIEYLNVQFGISLRIIKLENIQFYLTAFGQTSFSMFFAYFFYTYTDFENYGFVLAWTLVEIFSSIIQMIVYFCNVENFFKKIQKEENDIEFKSLENY